MTTDILKPKPYAAYSDTESYFDRMKWVGFKISDLRYPSEEFVNQYREMLWQFQRDMFCSIMQVEWADRQISYRGQNITALPGRRPNQGWSSGLKFFYQNYLGLSRKIWSDGFFKDIRSYADELFPNFESYDGFNRPFTYPFQYMPLEALCYVVRLKYRMELLNEGERMHLSLGKFYDYVAAYLTDIRVETGRTFQVYMRVWNDDCIPYVNEKISFIESQQRKNKARKEKLS